MNVFAKALTIHEASQLVRSMKTPKEIEQRINKLKAFSSTESQNLLQFFPIHYQNSI